MATKNSVVTTSLKRSDPSAIVCGGLASSSWSSDSNTAAWAKRPLPRTILLSPDPEEEVVKYESFVSETVCYCGLHSHSFTCKKPPRGWHKCRLCYPKSRHHKTRAIELYRDETEKDPDKQVKDKEVEPYDPFKHPRSDILCFPIKPGGGRDIAWVIDRPELKPLASLPESDERDAREHILSTLYKEMFPSNARKCDKFKEDCERWETEQVDYHPIHHDDKNNLFYSLLLGLVELSVLTPDAMSVQTLRWKLMAYLEKHNDEEFDGKTLEAHAMSCFSNVAGREAGTTQVLAGCTLADYVKLMGNVNGREVFFGGELEIYLLSMVEHVSIAIYRKEAEALVREKVFRPKNGRGNDRGMIHFCRVEGARPGSSPYIMLPKEHSYLLFTPKWRAVMKQMSTLDTSDLIEIYKNVSAKLVVRNGKVVDFNPLLTSLLGANSNLLHLGSTEQSKAALFYIGPYINKNGVKINDALPILLDAHDYALAHPSVAEDSGTNKRHAQHVLTRTVNKINTMVEVSDTQACVALLGMDAGIESESFVTFDVRGCVEYSTVELERSGVGMGEEESITGSVSEDEDDEGDVIDVGISCLTADDEDEKGNPTIQSFPSMQPEFESDPFESDLGYINASIGFAPIYNMNSGKKQPVGYPSLYRFRGEDLKGKNRLEYTSTVRSKPSNEAIRSGEGYRFGAGIGMEETYNQVLRSKQLTPQWKRGLPRPPEEKPHDESELAKWGKKADKFALYYLTIFRPEDRLYKAGQSCTYKYDWESFVEFYKKLSISDIAVDTLRLEQMNRFIHSWRVNKEKRDLMTDYRGKDARKWKDVEQQAAKSYFGYGGDKKWKGERDTFRVSD